MAVSKFKKFLFPTEEEYVPEINYSAPAQMSRAPISEPTTSNVKRDIFGQVIKSEDNEQEEIVPQRSKMKKESIRTQNAPSGSVTMVYNPSCYEDTKDIAVKLLGRNIVIVNLEQILRDETRRKDATRIIDYLCGVAFALQIEVEKVNATTFLFK